jgi:hypothetical protein
MKALSFIRKNMVPNSELDDPVSAKILENHFPHGVSSKTLVHLGQMITAGTGDGKNLSFFDWQDASVNQELYGQDKPP